MSSKNVLPAVSALGWERCPWTDDTFANKRIFLGAGARAGDDAWKTRLTVTEKSMGVMFQCPIDKHIKLAQTCSPLRLSKANMDEYAKQAALVVSLVDEVEAIVPIHDDTLQAMCVRPYIENDPQVHLDVCSALVTPADGFAPPGFGVCSRR